MSEPLSYAVPWTLLAGLTYNLRTGEPRNIHDFTASIVRKMPSAPLIEGGANLPADPRFVLAANHYQRKGLWILHTAAALTQAVTAHYRLPDPPVRWLVTANWPRWRFLGLSMPSPGDIVLPRVAAALQCYPVPFSGTDPAMAAATFRRMRRDLPTIAGPIGIFPEGAAASANRIGEALPGVTRLLHHLDRPVVPARVLEDGGRLVIRFGTATPAELVMAAIRRL
jgi:1-acyl-sn-glycerol-3-phosphate acyltransferase